ncbi:hypothetical protein [Flavobacterium sp.]|uniref:hypothetical protein n=1 Tax=Flavobacterium sp. TaxID=239 RepID=UPI0039E5FA71
MGHITKVYGNIVGATWKTEDYHKLQRLNKTIISNLPSDDNVFPWITRNMFLVPDPEKDKMYREQIIVFGASYKSVEDYWSEWLDKFEDVLKKLYWTSATIHLETELMEKYTYEWTIEIHQTENWFLEIPKPISKWKFEGGPRTFV